MRNLSKVAAVATGTVLVGFGLMHNRVRRYEITEDSMRPALSSGDYIVASRLDTTPRRGDVIIFQHPHRSGFFLSKRVIGLERERVVIDHGRVTANGHVIAEPWAHGAVAGDHQWELGPGQLVVLSDNRSKPTDDSRVFGPIPTSGLWRAEFTYWPPKSMGPIR